MTERLTVLHVPAREDLRKPQPFKVGDRVRMKKEHLGPGVDQALWTGVVAYVPEGPVVQLGPHTLGNELGVDMDFGGRGVADPDKWERA